MGNTQLWVPVDPTPFDQSTWNLTGVITSAVWPHTPKIVKIGPAGPPRNVGEISCSNVFFYLFLYFFLTSCAPLESIFLTVSPPFLRQTTCFGGDWFPRGPIFNTKIFPHLNPKKTQFYGLRKFSPKRSIMGMLISKLPLIVTAAP